MRARTVAISLALGVLAAIGLASPAYADHNGGAELYEPDTPHECYAGAIYTGTPPIDIFTTKYALFEKAGRLNLVCYFTVPSYVPASGEGTTGDSKGEWFAPTKPTISLNAGTCLPPGVDASSELYRDDETRPVPQAQAKIVAYKTSIVMYCSWPLNELP